MRRTDLFRTFLRNLRPVAACALGALAWSACDSSPSESELVAFSTVVELSYSGITSARRDVIRDQDEWAVAWSEIHGGVNPVPSRPAVDFSETMLILAALGERPSGCHQIEIASIRAGSGTLDVSIVEIEPGPSCVCTLAITHPVHVVRLDRRDAIARYDTSRRSLSCG